MSLLDVANDPSWATLLPKAAVLLLQTVADQPMSLNAATHLKTLDILLSSQSSSKPSGSSRAVLQSLLSCNYFSLLGQAISRIVSANNALPFHLYTHA